MRLRASFVCALSLLGCGGRVVTGIGVPDYDAPSVSPPDTFASETSPSEVTVDSGVGDAETSPKKDATLPKCDPHPGDECDMVAQDCTDPKDTCEYNPTAGHNTCSTRPPGAGTKAAWCSTTEPCGKGLFCYGSRCSPACCPGDSSPCGPKGYCTLAITDTDKSVIYHVCFYEGPCSPFRYDCPTGKECYYTSDPDLFTCAAPSKPGTTPGGKCTYRTDCGESQGCFKLTTGGDSAPVDSMCYLFCWITKPSGFTPGTTPDGRFPADGTCNIGGVDYGTCTPVGTIGGGLGLCIRS